MIKTKQPQNAIERHNPFQGTKATEHQTVGATIGERRAMRHVQGTLPSRSQSITQDNFNREARKPDEIQPFNDNTFKSGRRFSVSGRPYVRPLVDRIEKGTAPQINEPVKRPSDTAIVNFLSKVIDHYNKNSSRKTAPNGNPIKNSRVK